MKKRIIALAIGSTVLLLIAACGGKQVESTVSQEPSPSISEPATTTPTTPEETSQPVEETGEVKTLGGKTNDTGEEVGAVDEVSTVDEVVQSEEIQLFTEVNETVYATGTVNIRESWSASSTKLGSLNKGDAVTRTGNAIAGTEAEGWSRVSLADGSTVYISNTYLSTTKPVTQTQSKPTGGGTTQTQKPATGGGGTTQTPPPSSGESDGTPPPGFVEAWGQALKDNGYVPGRDHELTEEEAKSIEQGLNNGYTLQP